MKPLVPFLLVLLVVPDPAGAQWVRPDRRAVSAIFREVRRDVDELYHDPELRGIDWRQRVDEVAEQAEQAASLGEVFELVDELLAGMGDSHTFIIPPAWNSTSDYGFEARFVGDTAVVVAVAEGPAHDAGLRVGDELLFLGDAIERGTLSRTWYRQTVVNPRAELGLSVRRLSGSYEVLSVRPEIRQRASRRLAADPWGDPLPAWTLGDEPFFQHTLIPNGVAVWRLDLFDPDDRDRIRDAFSTFSKSRALILDLRANRGGALDLLPEMLRFVSRDSVAAGFLVGRNGEEGLRAPSVSEAAFDGTLLVLVSSATASTGEMLAAVLQESGRATVIGDRTAGSGMVSQVRPHTLRSQGGQWSFAVSVAVAQFLTPGRRSLEGVGVTPDLTLLPTRQDLADGLDPVMAAALQRLGLDWDARRAAEVFGRSGGS